MLCLTLARNPNSCSAWPVHVIATLLIIEVPAKNKFSSRHAGFGRIHVAQSSLAGFLRPRAPSVQVQ